MSLIDRDKIRRKINDGIIVRGTGLHAARCSYLFMGLEIKIHYYLTVNRNNTTFRRKPVYSVAENPYHDMYVVVATDSKNYCVIAEELRNEGKKEFIDFAYYEWLVKDIVLLHGNCHMEILKSYLLSAKAFQDKYLFYPYPLLVSSTKTFRTEPEIFENVDIWIHEDIRDDNIFGFEVSDNYIRNYIDKDVKEICIPHLYGVGRMIFPQIMELSDDSNEPINDGVDTDGLFLYGDWVVESCIKNGMQIEQIIDFCKSDIAIPPDQVLENFSVYVEKIKEREKSWDIKISEFILKTYKQHKLFYDDGHPTNVIMEYIARRVLDMLNISEENLACLDAMDAHEKCVYPCVKKALGLEWEEYEVRKSGKKLCDHMDFDEFIKEYCYWRHFDTFFASTLRDCHDR